MQPIMQFKSHIEGRNADVAIYPDRIEWSKQRGKSAMAAVATGGLSLLKSSKQESSEMIPVRSISSVVTKKDGFTQTKVSVICSGNTVDFRVPHTEAQTIKQTITSLLLGSHPSQQPTVAAPSVPPPPTPAGWNPDPNGVHELRYWDGLAWTAHVSDAGVQSTD